MKAKQLVKRGKELIGRWIVTEPMGDYPGGIAQIVDLGHDKAAPEIVMNVRLPRWGKVGVFEHEEVELLKSANSPPRKKKQVGDDRINEALADLLIALDLLEQVEDASTCLFCGRKGPHTKKCKAATLLNKYGRNVEQDT